MTQIGNPIKVWELPAPISVPAPKEDPAPKPVKEPVKV
jgi:hypothetical protein